jgi:hypothetical protein
MSVREELRQLYHNYQHKFEEVVKPFPNDDIAGPLLMSPDDTYSNQRIKLLIVGQETNGWGYFSSNIDEGMIHYENFNLGIDYYSSPFWNITRKVERLLGNDEYSCAWTNISKYDVNAKRPSGSHLKEIEKIDDLLLKEIKVLKPDVVIFYTGPDLDYRLKKIFNSLTYKSIEGFTERQFTRLIHPLLPQLSFRSYHPRSLRMRKVEAAFIEYLKNETSQIQ